MELLSTNIGNITELLLHPRTLSIVRCGFWIVIGIPLVYQISKWIRSLLSKRFAAQQGMVVGNIVRYFGLIIIIVTVFKELGFNLTPLLGAAGIVGIALGFASQTSVSNIISGIFLIIEKPFEVDDLITVGSTTGLVLSVDMLSVKIRTLDNKFVRIPNETIIKSEVTNVTRFPIRRIDLTISIAFKEDVKKVRETLLDIAANNNRCLQEPEPIIIISGFGNLSVDLVFAIWCRKEDWLSLKNEVYEQIKNRFDEDDIEIPFSHLSLYSGLGPQPMPIQIVQNKDNK